MISRVDNIGQLGVIYDVPPQDAPNGAATSVQNMRFIDGAAENFPGQQVLYSGLAIQPIQTWYMKDTGGQDYWIYADVSAVYATDGSNHSDISSLSSTHTMDINELWSGFNFSGVFIMNDSGGSAPQQWTPGLANNLTELSNWPAGLSCRILRPFRSWLIALDCTESATHYPQMIRWSSATEPGAVPASWDYTSPSQRSGRVELAGDGYEIVDCRQMRDWNVIYKTHSIYLQQWVGGNSVFQFRRQFGQIGALSDRCIAAWGHRHVVAGDGDIIVHDGQMIESIANNRVRRKIYSSMSQANYGLSFAVSNPPDNEIWFCYAEEGESVPHIAAVWNWRDNNWGFRDIPPCYDIAFGVSDPSLVNAGTFDSYSAVSFDNMSEQFDKLGVAATNLDALHIPDYSNNRILRVGEGWANLGQDVECVYERQNVILGDPQDTMKVKGINRILPKVVGTAGETVYFYVGVRDTLLDTVSWSSAMPFTIGTDHEIYYLASGRVVDIKMVYTGQSHVRLYGFDVDWFPEGDY